MSNALHAAFKEANETFEIENRKIYATYIFNEAKTDVKIGDQIIKINDKKIVSENIVDTNGSGHGALASFLKEKNVDALICGGIGGGAKVALENLGIKLFGGVCGVADAAVNAFIAGKLIFNPNIQCSHHHNEEHDCSSHHDCGNHDCH